MRIAAEGLWVACTDETEWTQTLIPAAREVDPLIVERYFYYEGIQTHLRLTAIEAHLNDLRPRRPVLTHRSDDMLVDPDRTAFESAEDGKGITSD